MSASVSTGPESSAVTDAPAPADGAPPGTQTAVEADVTALIQLSGLVRDTFQRVAERHDLTPVQARMLCVLAEKPRGMAELARLFGVGKANLTGLVDRAAQRHLVERSLVPGDRRAVQVVLTDDGRRSALAFHQSVIEELDRLLAPLAPQARADFRKSAGVIAQAAGHAGTWPPHQGC
ncbi:MarR family transcriptional regulator [Streptomyces sp. AD681]|uniref:MarR family winged helix-turn-helix transcriptional regulator n=1 Tax=Streptomyces sp. AD681 TaxID=3019069 RepID=UPI0022F1719A|nr:MarR family transcriptional regulator [Streptomyces sp. AD681]MDA5147422.1 MarR family transcriptional regulator [Streptomyces sp. AD681]